MSRRLHLSPHVLDEIRAHGREAYPEECCGFLFGRDGDPRQVTVVQRTENVAAENRRRRFRIAPLAYLRAERYALAEGLDFLGIYHTHPDHPAIASEHDRKQAQPGFSYLILSVRDGEAAEFRSWELQEDVTMGEETLLNTTISTLNT